MIATGMGLVCFMVFAFIIGVVVLVCLLLLLIIQSEKYRRPVKIVFLFTIAIAILLAIPIVIKACSFHIKRRAYVKMLKSYVPPELRDEVPRSFFSDAGAYDWYRFALVYPYSVDMIDTTDNGHLRKERDEDPEIGGQLTHLTFDAKLMVARVYFWYYNPREKVEPEIFWIVFNFSSGRFDKFPTEEQALAEAKKRGFSGKQILEDLETHYDRFTGDLSYSPPDPNTPAKTPPDC